MNDDLVWTASAYAALAGAALLALAAILFFLRWRHARWLPLQRLRPGKWGGYEVLLAFLAQNVLPLVIVALLTAIGFFGPLLGPAPDLEKPGEAAERFFLRGIMIASPLTFVVTLGIIFAALYWISRTRPQDYGLSWVRWPANLGLGIAAFLIVTPLVLGLHALLTWGQEDNQPFKQLAKLMQGWEWLFLAFQVTVAGPALEEIVFRGILLGWLRRTSLTGHAIIAYLTIVSALLRTPTGETPSAWDYVGPGLFALACVAVYVFFIHRLARRFELNGVELRQWRWLPADLPRDDDGFMAEETLYAMRRKMRDADQRRQADWTKKNAYLALFGSAMVFAVFHTETWPAPVPLLFLALVLGWLAVRTQSLIACITLHALFNLVSLIALYGSTVAALG